MALNFHDSRYLYEVKQTALESAGRNMRVYVAVAFLISMHVVSIHRKLFIFQIILRNQTLISYVSTSAHSGFHCQSCQNRLLPRVEQTLHICGVKGVRLHYGLIRVFDGL